MLSSVRRFRRTWRAKARLLAPVTRGAGDRVLSPFLFDPALDDGRPVLPPYQGLAAVWHEYVSGSLIPGRWQGEAACYFVLRRSDESAD